MQFVMKFEMRARCPTLHGYMSGMLAYMWKWGPEGQASKTES